MNITSVGLLQIDIEESWQSSGTEEDKSGTSNTPDKSLVRSKKGYRRSPSDVVNRILNPPISDKLRSNPLFNKNSQFGFTLRPMPAPAKRGKSGDSIGSSNNVDEHLQAFVQIVQHKRQAILRFEYGTDPEFNLDKCGVMPMNRQNTHTFMAKSDKRDENDSDGDAASKVKYRASQSFYDFSDNESKQAESDAPISRRNSFYSLSQNGNPTLTVLEIPPKLKRNQVSMIISDKDKEPNSAIHLKKNKNRRGSNQKKGGMKKQKDLSVPRRQEYCDSDDFKQDSKIPVVNPNKYKPFDFKKVERLGLKTQECHSMLSFVKYSQKGVLFDKMERGRIKITVGLELIQGTFFQV